MHDPRDSQCDRSAMCLPTGGLQSLARAENGNLCHKSVISVSALTASSICFANTTLFQGTLDKLSIKIEFYVSPFKYKFHSLCSFADFDMLFRFGSFCHHVNFPSMTNDSPLSQSTCVCHAHHMTP
jgi:hypothetical protein